MRFNTLRRVRASDCGEEQCIAVRRYRRGLKIRVIPHDHGIINEPQKLNAWKVAFSPSVLLPAPREVENCGQSAPKDISFGYSAKDCNPTRKQFDGDTAEHNIQGACQDLKWPFNLTWYNSAPDADDVANDQWSTAVDAKDLMTVPTYLKAGVGARHDDPIVDTLPDSNDSPHGGSSNFDKNWIKLNEGEIGFGSFGSVCRAVRKSSSSQYKASEKGKIYAIKRTHFQDLDVQELHSLRHERLLHSVAKLDASWKSIGLFAFMVECETNVKFPSWAAYQYCEGRTLHSVEAAFSSFVPAGLVIDVMDDISTALTWLHGEVGHKPRMAHCDFHSGNVMLDLSRPVPYGRHPYICIVDFGLANFVPGTGSDREQAEMTFNQNTDINDFGHLIHEMIHHDGRYCGRGAHTQPDQVNHCYQNHWRSPNGNYFPPCPGLVDPNTALFHSSDQEFWWLMMQGCFRPMGRDICNISLTMADISYYLQGYIARARRYLWSLPNQKAMYDNTMSILQGMKRAPPMLPKEHLPTPPPPPQPPSGIDTPLPQSQPPRKLGKSFHLHAQDDHAESPAQLSPLPDYEYYEPRQLAMQHGSSAALGHQGAQPQLIYHLPCDQGVESNKRKLSDVGADQDFGINEPFAKRFRAQLVKEIARLDAQAQLGNSRSPAA